MEGLFPDGMVNRHTGDRMGSSSTGVFTGFVSAPLERDESEEIAARCMNQMAIVWSKYEIPSQFPMCAVSMVPSAHTA